MKLISIECIDESVRFADPFWWRRLMYLLLQEGDAFEIRCWREETEALRKALLYGQLSEKDCTSFEYSVKGTWSKASIHTLLQTAPPSDNGRMTEFFTITSALFSSEHYGKEIFLFDPAEELLPKLTELFSPIRAYFSFGESFS